MSISLSINEHITELLVRKIEIVLFHWFLIFQYKFTIFHIFELTFANILISLKLECNLQFMWSEIIVSWFKWQSFLFLVHKIVVHLIIDDILEFIKYDGTLKLIKYNNTVMLIIYFLFTL